MRTKDIGMAHNTMLYAAVTGAGITVQHACEVGVYLPETSNVLGWIEAGARTTLIECDPVIVDRLRARFGDLPQVRIHDVAVADAVGTLTLYRTGASTFGANVDRSPAVVNDAYQPAEADAFTVHCVPFDQLDDGTIDVLSVDIEGAEWHVLKHLRSRPAVISLETHGRRYVNPHLREIESWAGENGYGAWYRDASDTVLRRGWTLPAEDRSPPLSRFGRLKRRMRGY